MTRSHKSAEFSAQATALESMCQNFSQGLHAAAQPLSILLAGLGNPALSELNLEELRELVATSAVEAERACTIFNYLQQLVSVETIKPELSAVTVGPLLVHAAEGVELPFRERGISLRATIPDEGHEVLISRKRSLEALSSVLLIALAEASPADVVELFVDPDSSVAVRVTIRNSNANIAVLDAQAKLVIALAKAKMRSQGADLVCSFQPLTMRIDLPIVPQGHQDLQSS